MRQTQDGRVGDHQVATRPWICPLRPCGAVEPAGGRSSPAPGPLRRLDFAAEELAAVDRLAR